MADKPTPMRRPDPRLSNLVLEGGRRKAYPPPPPPPDLTFNTEIGGADPWSLVVFSLFVILMLIIFAMIYLGCTPLRCP